MATPIKAWVDRIEGDLAVMVVHGRSVTIPRGCLPAGAREGSHLTLTVDLDPESEGAERQSVGDLLRRRKGGGDLDL